MKNVTPLKNQKIESDWQQKLRKGDNTPLSTFFHLYNDLCVSRLVGGMNCDRETAKDIFLDALIDLRDKVIGDGKKEINDVKAYITGTCRNMFLKRIAANSSFYKKTSDIQRYYYKEALGEENFDLLVKGELEEMETKAKQDRLKQIQKSLNSLGKKCQTILKQFYIHKKSMVDIATEMGFSSANVAKTTKSRCFKKWRENIAL